MSRASLANRYKVTDGRKFKLSDYDPRDDGGLGIDKGEAKERLEQDIKSLAIEIATLTKRQQRGRGLRMAW